MPPYKCACVWSSGDVDVLWSLLYLSVWAAPDVNDILVVASFEQKQGTKQDNRLASRSSR
jgi:hypothetical protein